MYWTYKNLKMFLILSDKDNKLVPHDQGEDAFS